MCKSPKNTVFENLLYPKDNVIICTNALIQVPLNFWSEDRISLAGRISRMNKSMMSRPPKERGRKSILTLTASTVYMYVNQIVRTSSTNNLYEYKQYKSRDTEQWTTFHRIDYAINAEERSSVKSDVCRMYVRVIITKVDKYCSWAILRHRIATSTLLNSESKHKANVCTVAVEKCSIMREASDSTVCCRWTKSF